MIGAWGINLRELMGFKLLFHRLGHQLRHHIGVDLRPWLSCAVLVLRLSLSFRLDLALFLSADKDGLAGFNHWAARNDGITADASVGGYVLSRGLSSRLSRGLYLRFSFLFRLELRGDGGNSEAL